MQSLRKILTIPNLLSFYRILSFPIVLFFALSARELVYISLLMVNLLTDILDGYLARKLGLTSEFGARLDSIADVGTYLLAITGILIFKVHEFIPYKISFSVFVFLFISANCVSLIKFKRLPSLHLYSWKLGGYIQGSFFFTIFFFDFYPVFYYLMVIWGIFSFTEHILIQLLLKEMKSNRKGLWWVLKDLKTY